MNYNPIYDLLRADGSIVINKNLIFSLGLNESIIYAELVSRYIYFANKNDLTEDGYFFNTINDLHAGTGLGEKPQRAAIKNLQKLGLIDKNLRGIPPKRYFKVVDNSELLANLLRKGNEIKAEILTESQLRPYAGIESSQVAELKTPYGLSNNTKPNNTKKIIQTAYIDLPIDGHIFFKIYGRYFREKFNKKHMKLTEEQFEEVSRKVEELSCCIDNDTFIDGVYEHFSNLPKRNNGNIIAFLKATMRYFTIHTE